MSDAFNGGQKTIRDEYDRTNRAGTKRSSKVPTQRAQPETCFGRRSSCVCVEAKSQGWDSADTLRSCEGRRASPTASNQACTQLEPSDGREAPNTMAHEGHKALDCEEKVAGMTRTTKSWTHRKLDILENDRGEHSRFLTTTLQPKMQHEQSSKEAGDYHEKPAPRIVVPDKEGTRLLFLVEIRGHFQWRNDQRFFFFLNYVARYGSLA